MTADENMPTPQPAEHAVLDDLRRSKRELEQRLRELTQSGAIDRRRRSAALNLLEDAVRARAEALRANASLQKRIDERQAAEAALRESEAQLNAAREQFRQFQESFEKRVKERTRELQAREERLRDLATLLKRTEQSERQRLARLLHDHVQQLLVAAKMRVDAVAGQLDEPLLSDLQHAVGVLNEAIHATRDLSVQLTPPLLHDQGLPVALHWLASRVRRQSAVDVEECLDEEANPASEDEREILFQAAQEFLLNASKHAQTDQVCLSLKRAPGWMRLEVADQGVGFDLAVAPEGGFGLFQIRQRLESVGGFLIVKSAPGEGTTMTAVIPGETAPASAPADS